MAPELSLPQRLVIWIRRFPPTNFADGLHLQQAESFKGTGLIEKETQ